MKTIYTGCTAYPVPHPEELAKRHAERTGHMVAITPEHSDCWKCNIVWCSLQWAASHQNEGVVFE